MLLPDPLGAVTPHPGAGPEHLALQYGQAVAFFRRSRPASSPRLSAGDEAASPVELVGIEQGDADPSAFYPYEFKTERGVWVRLHDMRYLGFEYEARSRALTLRFLYDDPAWTPADALSTPLARFQFEGVKVRQWEDGMCEPEWPVGARGQVSDLMLEPGGDRFFLDTYDTWLVFSARRLQVDLLPYVAPTGR